MLYNSFYINFLNTLNHEKIRIASCIHKKEHNGELWHYKINKK